MLSRSRAASGAPAGASGSSRGGPSITAGGTGAWRNSSIAGDFGSLKFVGRWSVAASVFDVALPEVLLSGLQHGDVVGGRHPLLEAV